MSSGPLNRRPGLSDAAFFQTVKWRSVRRTAFSSVANADSTFSPGARNPHSCRAGSLPSASWLERRLRRRSGSNIRQNLVLSESPPVHHVSRGGGRSRPVRWLRGLVRARPPLARRRAHTSEARRLERSVQPGIVRRRLAEPWPGSSLPRAVQVLASALPSCGADMVPGAIDPELFCLPPDRRHARAA